jgi:acetylornithine deacetylase/succinyl-diaminopimelate desuccinylase-like protein
MFVMIIFDWSESFTLWPMSRVLLAVFLLLAATAAQTAEQVRAYRRQNEVNILRDFAALLSMPNVAQASAAGHADIERNAAYIRDLFQKRGLRTELLEVSGGFPAIYAELLVPGATKTVVFYAHYDGQPVIATKWQSPPFAPTLRTGALGTNEKIIEIGTLKSGQPLPSGAENWRLYARSASDDKAPIIGFLTALDALRANKIQPDVNLKFFLEGEEEAGSDHLEELLKKYSDLLRSDLWILCDGPAHQSGRMQLVYGARGVMGLEMTVYGPNRGLHSGHYGNWAPNPAAEIANVIASMRDTDGRIKIKDFYNHVAPLTPAEKRALADVPDMDIALQQAFALGRTEGGGQHLNRLIMNPALNVRGIRSGAVGAEAANAIMTDATASIDFRLVPRQTPEGVRQQVEAHLRSLGYEIVYEEPTEESRRKHPRLIRLQWAMGYPAARTPLDSTVASAIAKVMSSAIGAPLIRMPTLGGSVPMYLFEQRLKTPVLILPIANYDNNQHSHNENIRLGNLWTAIDIYASLFAELGKTWR